MRDIDARVARREPLHHLAEIQDRAGDRAPGEDECDAEGDQHARQEEDRQEPLDLAGEGARLVARDGRGVLDALAEADEEVVQGLAIGPVLLVVALGIGGFRRNLAPEACGFAAEGDELIDALGDLADGLALFRRCDLLEICDEAAQRREALHDALGEGFGLFGRIRHVDST